MLDISGSPDHLTETGVATSTTAPIKVAPIKSIFSIVVLLNKDTRLILNHSSSIGTLIIINFACDKKSPNNATNGPHGWHPRQVYKTTAFHRGGAAALDLSIQRFEIGLVTSPLANLVHGVARDRHRPYALPSKPRRKSSGSSSQDEH